MIHTWKSWVCFIAQIIIYQKTLPDQRSIKKRENPLIITHSTLHERTVCWRRLAKCWHSDLRAGNPIQDACVVTKILPSLQGCDCHNSVLWRCLLSALGCKYTGLYLTCPSFMGGKGEGIRLSVFTLILYVCTYMCLQVCACRGEKMSSVSLDHSPPIFLR